MLLRRQSGALGANRQTTNSARSQWMRDWLMYYVWMWVWVRGSVCWSKILALAIIPQLPHAGAGEGTWSRLHNLKRVVSTQLVRTLTTCTNVHRLVANCTQRCSQGRYDVSNIKPKQYLLQEYHGACLDYNYLMSLRSVYLRICLSACLSATRLNKFPECIPYIQTYIYIYNHKQLHKFLRHNVNDLPKAA